MIFPLTPLSIGGILCVLEEELKFIFILAPEGTNDESVGRASQ